MVVARALWCWHVVFIPIHEPPAAASFAFGRFAFAFVAPGFVLTLFAFSLNVVCIAASRFGINRQVAVLTDEVIGESCEVSC